MSDQDQTDAWFNSKKKEDSQQDSQVLSKPAKPKDVEGISAESDCYDMGHFRRGTALIFNHYKFDDIQMSPRSGTDMDAMNLKATLSLLKFDVTVHDDLKYAQLYEVLQEASAEDYTDSDCLLVIVMSHGDTGVIHARDHTYPPDMLWAPFTGDICPSLAGKPKLFFIQACRGEELDKGVKIKSRTMHDSKQIESYVLPAMADFLIMYSTAPGHYSFRSPTNGSWFVQCLCKELAGRARKQDLMTILTFVNRSMAIDYQSNTPGNHKFHNKKQIGSIVSSMTRLLFFFPDNDV